jgi:hypothetical protein
MEINFMIHQILQDIISYAEYLKIKNKLDLSWCSCTRNYSFYYLLAYRGFQRVSEKHIASIFSVSIAYVSRMLY